jgi:thiol-disulfide isomerase/thioredoxin
VAHFHSRKFVRPFVLAALAVSLTTLAAQTPAGQTPTPAPAPAPAQAAPRPAPAQPIEQLAYNAAIGITDPAREAASLKSLLDNAQFKQHGIARQARNTYFTLLVTKLPDRKDEISATLDVILADLDAPAAPAGNGANANGAGANANPNAAAPSLTAAAQALADASKAVNAAAAGTPLPAAAPAAQPVVTPMSRLNTISGLASTLADGNMLLDRIEPLLTKALAGVTFEDYAKPIKESAEKAKAANPARTVPTDAELKTSFDGIRGRSIETLARIHVAQGNPDKAEGEFKTALAATPMSLTSELGLAQIEMKRGHEPAALDHYMLASLSGRMKPADTEAMNALYTKTHGKSGNIDADLDKLYNERLPNPVKVTPYTPVKDRSNRVVIAEMFTGSGCPPCVAADLAMDALMEHYVSKDVIFLAYHANIPQPDPMVVAGSDTRRTYYKVPGVPTIHVDGGPFPGIPAMYPSGMVGGGGRDNSPTVYADYIKIIDKELATPATADLSLRAQRNGSHIKVAVNITKLPADAKDPRLHIVLAEDEMRFAGENGIRFHSMVVRAVAGEKAEDGSGFALTADAKSINHTFDLKIIPADLTKTLATEMEKRHKADATAGRTPDYKAEGHAMTTIDPEALFVVAYIQDANQKVLQAVTFDLSPNQTALKDKKKKK